MITRTRSFCTIPLLGLTLTLGGCVTGDLLGERDAALVTSRYEELE